MPQLTLDMGVEEIKALAFQLTPVELIALAGQVSRDPSDPIKSSRTTMRSMPV